MPITGLNYETSVISRIQSTPSGSTETRSNVMKVVHMTGAEGTYDTGGMVLEPSYFGYEELLYVSPQPFVVADIGDNNAIVTQISISYDTDIKVWKMHIYLPAEGGAWTELPEGTQVEMLPGVNVSIMVCGN